MKDHDIHFPDLPSYIHARVKVGDYPVRSYLSGNTYVDTTAGRTVRCEYYSDIHYGGPKLMKHSWSEGFITTHPNIFSCRYTLLVSERVPLETATKEIRMSQYLDDMNVEVGDVVRCVSSMNSPFTKAGHDYLVVSTGPDYAIERKCGTTVVNPSARFVGCTDIYGFPVHETQWRYQ